MQLAMQEDAGVFRTQQHPLVVPAPFARLSRGQGHALSRKPLHRLQRPERPLDARRADLELVAPRDGLVHVQAIREPPAEPGAVSHRDTPRLVEEHPDHPMPSEEDLLHVHHLEA